MKTNVTNLKRARDLIERTHPTKIKMSHFRMNRNDMRPKCGTTGCIVGLCTELDSKNIEANYYSNTGCINFSEWSSDFFGVSPRQWIFLFDYRHVNDKQGHLNRLQYVIDHPEGPWPCERTGHLDFSKVFKYPKEEEQNEKRNT